MADVRLPNILHEDNHLLAVVKPAGLLAQADETGDPDVLSLMKAHRARHGNAQGTPYLGLVHRLDRPASGVMVLGCTPDAARDLTHQFRERLADKRYLVLVEGVCTGLGRCEDYIAKEGRTPHIVAPSHAGGKRAVLTWQSVAQSDGKSLLNVQLETGRPHQIRLQLSERGHPVVGDVRYGAAEAMDGRTIALHSFALRIEHPDTGRVHAFTAAPPDVWAGVLDDALRDAVRRVMTRT